MKRVQNHSHSEDPFSGTGTACPSCQRSKSGADHAGVERLSTRSRYAQKKPARARSYTDTRAGPADAKWAKCDASAAAPSKPPPGRLEAIEAQIRDEIAVMQGVMISDLRQNEHLVRLEAKEVRRVIEVRIGESGIHAIAVIERAFEVGLDLGLRTLCGSCAGGRFTLDV